MPRISQFVAVAALAAAALYSENCFAGNPPDFGSPQVVKTAIGAGNGNIMVMGDFNGDGIPDVAILGSISNPNNGVSTGVVEVHFGDGANSFLGEASTFTNGTSGTEFGGDLSQGIAAADLDGGTNWELIFPAGNAVLIYEWMGTRFVETQSIDISGTGMTSAYWVAVGNLTAPNSQDIIVADEFGDTGVVWIPNDGHGNFGTPVAYPIGGGLGGNFASPQSSAYHPLVLANVNGQNALDDVILCWGNPAYNTPGSSAGSTVGVLLNNGDSTLSSEVSYGNPALFGVANSIVEPLGLTVADVDGDGKLDLVTMCYTFDSVTGAQSNFFSVNLGNGDGTFQDGKAFYAGAQGISTIDAADMTGAGRVDMVTADGSELEGGFTVTQWSGTGASLAVAEQDHFIADSHYYNSMALGYKTANGAFVTFNNDKKVDVLIGTSDVLYDANNNPYSQFVVFQNDTVLKLAATSLHVLGKIAAGGPILFYATQTSTPSGLTVRVQSTMTTNIEGSWTDLPDGHGGQMALTLTGVYSFGTAGTVYYPGGAAVYFRAISSAPGYADSISPPIGPYKLEQAQLTINARLTSTTDPSGTLQVTHIGDNLTYTLIWTNIGTATATGLEVQTPVPSYHDAASGIFVQFAQSDLSFNSYGQYVPASSPGANNAKVVWKVSNLKPGSSQAEVLTIQIGAEVQTNQFIVIPNSYSVASTNGQPPVGATGLSSGAARAETQVLPPMSFTIASSSPKVAPGGLLTYTFALTNFTASIVTNPVVVVDVPQYTRFAGSYPTGPKTSVPGVAFVSHNIAGTLYKDVFYQNGDQSQVVISFGPLAACPNAKGLNAVTFSVTFQAQWVDPAVVSAISTPDYLAAFVSANSIGSFNAAFSTAGITAATAGSTDFYALLSGSGGNIALSQNGSGVVSVPLQGSIAGAPSLHLLKTLSTSLNNLQNDGNGHTVDLVQPGQDITFILTAYNDGAADADDVFIEDVMPQSCSFVSAAFLFATPKSKSSPSTLVSAANGSIVQDADGQHLQFVGLRVEAGDYLNLEYTVRVFDGSDPSQPAPAPDTFIDPIVAIDPASGLPEPASIGSSSTPRVWFGFYFSEPIEVIGTAQFAQLGISTLVPNPGMSADVIATSNALAAFYLKYPNSVPLTDANNPASFYPGTERYYFHYQNSGAAVSGARIEVPLPAGTAFFRASFVNMPAGMPGKLPGVIIPIPKGAGIVPPSTPNGTVTFNLPPLSVGTNGDVMVEVIVTADNYQLDGSLLGDPTAPMAGIYDSTVPASARSQARKKDDGEPVLVAPHSSLTPFNSLPLTADYRINPLPRIGLMKTAPIQVRQGDQFKVTVTVFNYGDADANPTTLLIIPDNTEFVSVDAGQSDAAWTTDPLNGNDSGAVEATLASNNGPTANVDNPLKAHTAAGMTVTLLATGPIGSSIVGAPGWDADPSNARVDMPYAGQIDPLMTSTAIVDPSTPLSTATQTVFTSLPLFQPVISGADVAIIDLGTNSSGVDVVVVQGPPNLIAQGAGNLIGQDSANIVASGAGNAMPISAGTGASYLANQAKIVASGAGNLLAPEGAVAPFISGANIVASGAGNIVASGAGNIVASGAGNIVASGAGNIVASGAGNIVASGAGNLVNPSGSNAREEDASQEKASSAGFILASAPGSTALIRTAAGNQFGVGGGSFKPYPFSTQAKARAR